MAKNIHVVPHDGAWAVRPEGGEITSTHRTQEEAITQARQEARAAHVELLIHGENGQIRARDSYGHDPNPPKDSNN